MELAQKSSMHWTSACRSWGMFSPPWALTGRTGSPPSWIESSASTAETSSGVSYWSHWLSTARTGRLLPLKLPIPGQLLVGPPGQHENGDVRFFQGLFGLLDPGVLPPQLTRVVQSGRVDEHDGSHAAQLKAL